MGKVKSAIQMLIYLLRHADAESYAQRDAQRKLTVKGIDQGARVGRFCKEHDLVPALILASPYERAKETAFLVGQELGESPTPPEVEIAPFLGCGMTPETALDRLRDHSHLSAVMLVGHEPDLGQLAAHLLGSTTHCIHVRKASLTLIETSNFRAGAGVLHFSIPVELM